MVEKNTSRLDFHEQSLTLEKQEDYNIISKILFVIVLYNTRLIDSATYNSLGKTVKACLLNNQVDLLICDNSLLPQVDINNATNGNFNIYYLHDPSNSGISLSYNRAVELASIKEKKWVLVFDQDTEIPDDGLKKYIEGLKKWPGFPIYTPKVYSKNLLLSPCHYFMYRGSPLGDIKLGVNTLDRRNVINSGLLIEIKAYIEAGGYDEKVWLYYSDFVFFNKLKKIYEKFIVLDVKLEHELSSSDYSNISFALKRFTYYCQGAKAASDSAGSIYAYVCYGLTVALRSTLMCRRFKNIVFLKVFYKNYFF